MRRSPSDARCSSGTVRVERSHRRLDALGVALRLLAFGLYAIPWIVLQACWPIFVPAARLRLPPVPVTLAIGLGGTVALFALVSMLLPVALSRGSPGLAARWRSDSLRAFVPCSAFTAVNVGMRLPLAFGAQLGVTVALLGMAALAAHLVEKSRG